MNSYYGLVPIKLIGLSLFLLNQAAITALDLNITSNTIQDYKVSNLSICEEISVKYSSSTTKLNNRLEVNKNVNPTNHPKANQDLPQATIWWAADQFDPFEGNLIQNWLTYPQKQQINLVVDWQLWTALEYFERYRFVNQFGTVVRKYGYNLNVLSQKEQCLASYKYNSVSKPPKWELNLEKLGKDSLQVESSRKI